jgi:hypothetical protein
MLKRASIVAFLVALAVASTAGAANSNRTSTSSISLVVMAFGATSTTAPTSPSFGQQVTFAVSTTETTQPFVHLKCWQSKTLVLEGWQGFFDTALGSQQFVLGPTPAWQGGAATCTAYLENWDQYSSKGKVTQLASTTFNVAG